MKIIGKTRDGYLIEASAHEVLNLVGYAYPQRGAAGILDEVVPVVTPPPAP